MNANGSSRSYENNRLGMKITLNRLFSNLISKGCLKMFRRKASEIPRKESYIKVRRSDER
jgi:hypothetical protein